MKNQRKKREKSIHIRISNQELENIYARMEIVGINNVSHYIRTMAIKGGIINLDMSDFKEIIRLMRINSNNLNQYAKKANERGNIYKRDIDILQEQHEELWDLLNSILDKLGKL